MSTHQNQQKAVITTIEKQIASESLGFSTITPVANFDTDDRMCLTGVHLPSDALLTVIEKELINPLKTIDQNHYYYDKDSLHTTVKNIKTVKNPPDFTSEDIEKVKKVFSEIVPLHKKYTAYYYRLLVFPNNLALIGTTDEVLDDLVLDLDNALRRVGVPDDKHYTNEKYFFSNITLVRFLAPITKQFKTKVQELSNSLSIAPYTVDSVTLLTSNAALKRRTVIGTWNLQ